ncbi:acetolactate synthase [Thiobacillus denitrificans ATCC 25259]|uniref:Acetolactate synthase n=1 Tax=Thiobacillus denitrificans (strain ATCC 25259 / T1) TaxID=292415 RepID=Q3SHQ7_THIDA|nr:thiamine pyrophosphate-binding protein [Thiobacillus denitrificans]AAZ97829.1 acetolactate synthase [Thiobacillus denitrificans ATCC 25259]
MRYSDVMADWLKDMGFTHCFFVAGGNIMHMVASASKRFTCIPVVHEVAAGIATEYFNESSRTERAFALVTAGPGLTNIVTAIGGAWLESRELLVIGGQVKTEDLSRNTLRQKGIQEIAGVDIVRPITRHAILLDDVADRQTFSRYVQDGAEGRKGPVFIEIPLDVQGREVDPGNLSGPESTTTEAALPCLDESVLQGIVEEIRAAKRPMLLLGGGVHRSITETLYDGLADMGVPITTTWNGADRLGFDHPMYFGRPNTWGQRYSNLLLQQSDLIVALGTRLGLQQTGFNWKQFAPKGRVVQVDCDAAELTKGHPRVDIALLADANTVLKSLSNYELGDHSDWGEYCRVVREKLPIVDQRNTTREGYICPYVFVQQLSRMSGANDVVIPCSSGGAFTVMMQAFDQKRGQVIITDKGLASMGYGLSGAIGVAFAHPDRRVILVEGDGGFAQNLQELGTVAINKLNMKIFIFEDGGYASIRMTQRNYFGGHYVGCDRLTGLGLPNWDALFAAYGIPCLRIGPGFEENGDFSNLFNSFGVAAFLVAIDPEQTYFPKITSRVTDAGSMESNPLHRMTPDLDEELYETVGRYL